MSFLVETPAPKGRKSRLDRVVLSAVEGRGFDRQACFLRFVR